MLPVNADQRLVRFLCVSDFLCDAVLVPQLLDLLKPLFAQVQRISPSRKKTGVTLDAFCLFIYYSPNFPGLGKVVSYWFEILHKASVQQATLAINTSALKVC